MKHLIPLALMALCAACLLAILVSFQGCAAEGGDALSAQHDSAGAAAPSVGVHQLALNQHYFAINSNGGASLSGETSHKKATIRGWVMQWNDRTYTCPTGELCSRDDNPSRYYVKILNCKDTNTTAHWRDCELWARDDSQSAEHVWGGVSYSQSTNYSKFWLYGSPDDYGQILFNTHDLWIF
jgi:hypothetical protein